MTNFVNDTKHYHVEQATETEVLERWGKYYKKNDFDKITKFSKGGSLPYTYLMNEFKDLSKVRPIVAYAGHPMKRLLNFACRTLNHMLRSVHILHCMTLYTRRKNYEHLAIK